ncbi:MAG TPA: phytochelatin synthase family protein [Burkholderiaceae bacterium]|nr:phytochelatin synthase family protein [Burkholderiaceae bacterium]
MPLFARAAPALLWLAAALLGCQATTAPPAGVPAAAAVARAGAEPGLVPFASDEGLARLARSAAKADFPLLANQFEAQLNAAFCGPTSAAIVLNAVRGRSAALPRDHGRLRADDLRYLPSGFDPIVPRYTQDNVIEKGAKTRAQVLGEPIALADGASKRDFGYQLRQFDQMLRANGLATRVVVVDEARSEAAVRNEIAASLAKPGEFVVVNYRREAVGQQGGGHISPLGAYDAATDSFLVLDVNPAAAGWVWMPAATLVRGMRTFDTAENRGYVVVESR